MKMPIYRKEYSKGLNRKKRRSRLSSQEIKITILLQIIIDQVKNLSLEKFEEFVEQRKNEVELDKYEVKHFEEWRAMPIWVTTERAEEIKKNSTEGEKWNRYRMSEPIVLKNKQTIIIRRGQNTESISAVKKIFGLYGDK